MTDMQKSSGALIKTDEKGRVRTPAARRESLLEEFERSGLSGPKFAALAGIKYQTFAGWVWKRRRRPAGGGSADPAKPVVSGRWLEAVVEQAQPAMGLVLQLPGGIRAEVGDQRQAALAAMLIQALAQPC
jgi:hypothetical protein